MGIKIKILLRMRRFIRRALSTEAFSVGGSNSIFLKFKRSLNFNVFYSAHSFEK
jgi:hypothetical protein